MPARKNLIGCEFGRWKVIDYAGPGGSCAMWLCRCQCGSEKSVTSSSLLNGRSKSCGCYLKESARKRQLIHGHNTKKGQSPTYKSWRAMLKRCDDPKQNGYHNYGGKGIGVCDEWRSFECFLRDMGERPDCKTLDRIDNSLGYTKENCRWMSMKEQANNRSTNTRLTHQGKTHTISEWADILGIKRITISSRLFRGASIENALKA